MISKTIDKSEISHKTHITSKTNRVVQLLNLNFATIKYLYKIFYRTREFQIRDEGKKKTYDVPL